MPRTTTLVEAPPRILAEATHVALVARDFRLPVSLERGERLSVTTRDTGYTHVLAERGATSETRLVAEPGDRVFVEVGDERFPASPGEALYVERANDRLRVTAVAR